MDGYKQHLRRLAVHDYALLETIAVERSCVAASVIDERTAALLRVAATIAVDAALASFQHGAPDTPGAQTTRKEEERRTRCRPPPIASLNPVPFGSITRPKVSRPGT